MKRRFLWILLSVPILVAVSVLVSTSVSINSFAQVQPRGQEVVIFLCAESDTTFTVTSSSSSADAPTVASGTNCAQALADLLALRFRIVRVTPRDAGDVYMLNRRGRR